MDTAKLADKIQKSKEGAFEWQKRRHIDWDDNYTLYRDRVITNRLIQRQSVNIPLMKQSIRTILSNINDPPDLYFDNLDNDRDREIYFNEHWKECAENNKLIIKDTIDKKNVCLYGRSFKKLNILEGKPYIGIHDPYDILVDRYTDPADIDTAQFVIHQHIYKTLSSLENNVNYSKDEIIKIKRFFASEQGLIKSAENLRSAQAQQERMRQMEAEGIENLDIGEVWVELNENFIKLWDDQKKKWIVNFVVTSDQSLSEDGSLGLAILFQKPFHELMGKTKDDYWHDHYPLSWWGDDIEGTDIWSDGVADILRTPNKILNAWFSQMVENRTLRNFGLNYYDSTIEGFVPQTFSIEAWGWYPFPGDPNKGIKRVDIPDLSESIDEMNFIIGLAEKATAATSIQQGVSEAQKITLGEVQILQGNVQQRLKSLSPFYHESWRDFGEKYAKMIEAAGDSIDDIDIHRRGYNGTMFSKTVTSKMLKSKKGYKIRVVQAGDKSQKDLDVLQKLHAARMTMPMNQPLLEIYEKRLLEIAELTPEEQRQVTDFQKQFRLQQMEMAQMGGAGPELQPGQATTQLPNSIPQMGGGVPS